MRYLLFPVTIAMLVLSGACTLNRGSGLYGERVMAILPLSYSCVANSVDSPSRTVTLSIFVQNVSNETYAVGSTDPEADFAIDVFKVDGTRVEMSDQGQKTESIAQSMLTSGHIGSVRSTILKPLQSMEFEINISRIYSMSKDGLYYVVARRVMQVNYCSIVVATSSTFSIGPDIAHPKPVANMHRF